MQKLEVLGGRPQPAKIRVAKRQTRQGGNDHGRTNFVGIAGFVEEEHYGDPGASYCSGGGAIRNARWKNARAASSSCVICSSSRRTRSFSERRRSKTNHAARPSGAKHSGTAVADRKALKSGIGGLLLSQLWPDSLPVARAKVAASDNAVGLTFDVYAALWGYRRCSGSHLRKVGRRDANAFGQACRSPSLTRGYECFEVHAQSLVHTKPVVKCLLI